jgi:hypothetical protein
MDVHSTEMAEGTGSEAEGRYRDRWEHHERETQDNGMESRKRGGTPFSEFYKSFFPNDPCPPESNGINDILRLIQHWTPHDYEEWCDENPWLRSKDENLISFGRNGLKDFDACHDGTISSTHGVHNPSTGSVST